MDYFGYVPIDWFVLIQHELLLFAGFFFLLGAIDELAVDLGWLYLKFTGRTREGVFDAAQLGFAKPAGKVAVFIPAWDEQEVIGETISHLLKVWPDKSLRLYVGCYPNDAGTIEATMAAAGGDTRLRIVINERPGPSTKADCLNRLYRALSEDERRGGYQYEMVVLQDAEDLVDPSALALLRVTLEGADFVQLPVIPLPQARSPWIAGHYCEEFAEAHGKAMVVRDALGAAIPAAGVGCAIARPVLGALAGTRGDGMPFDAAALTEDYELGLRVAELGGRGRFLRLRDARGRLIATRSYFPAELGASVRQKTRWLHGIAFQGWEHMGWGKGAGEGWMRMRDRRGPLSALLLAIAYLLLAAAAITFALDLFGIGPAIALTPAVRLLLWVNLVALVWRAAWRFGFTRSVYGWRQGAMAVLRIPVSNIIAIMAARRALAAYFRSFAGAAPLWDKTSHTRHPARFPAPLDTELLRLPEGLKA